MSVTSWKVASKPVQGSPREKRLCFEFQPVQQLRWVDFKFKGEYNRKVCYFPTSLPCQTSFLLPFFDIQWNLIQSGKLCWFCVTRLLVHDSIAFWRNTSQLWIYDSMYLASLVVAAAAAQQTCAFQSFYCQPSMLVFFSVQDLPMAALTFSVEVQSEPESSKPVRWCQPSKMVSTLFNLLGHHQQRWFLKPEETGLLRIYSDYSKASSCGLGTDRKSDNTLALKVN